MVTCLAAPRGKDYAHVVTLGSPREEVFHIVDAYGDRRPRLEFSSPIEPIPVEYFLPSSRTKDYFVTVPAGEAASGVITVSGARLKKRFMQAFPEEFKADDPPPRLFVWVSHSPYDRGEDFGLDAWTGHLEILNNAVPTLPRW
jgi:hypothetical protein